MQILEGFNRVLVIFLNLKINFILFGGFILTSIGRSNMTTSATTAYTLRVLSSSSSHARFYSSLYNFSSCGFIHSNTHYIHAGRRNSTTRTSYTPFSSHGSSSSSMNCTSRNSVCRSVATRTLAATGQEIFNSFGERASTFHGMNIPDAMHYLAIADAVCFDVDSTVIQEEGIVCWYSWAC